MKLAGIIMRVLKRDGGMIERYMIETTYFISSFLRSILPGCSTISLTDFI